MTITILSILLAAAVIAVIVLYGRNARLQERLRVAQDQTAMQDRFSVMAQQSLNQNAEALRQDSQRGLREVLNPVREEIASFRQLVTDSYSRESRERFALGERVRELMGLNEIIGRETRRLSDALKGNIRVQGQWGEMILDNILERAGFRRGTDYILQESMADDEGRRLRPDVILNYTEGRSIVIDSKVSIQDYLCMLDATDDASRTRYAQAHIASIRKHVAELRNKKYQEVASGPSGLDYVLMFVPHEGAFLAAMNLDSKLWEAAFDSHVLIISPTHLLSIVKLIEQMWRQEKQRTNALAIADEAGKMLDKFRLFLDDMDKVGRSIGSAQQTWNTAYAKLATGPGNLMGRARKLEALGAKGKKALPQLDDEDLDT